MYLFDHRITTIFQARNVISEDAQDGIEIYLGKGAKAAVYIPDPKPSSPAWATLFEEVLKNRQPIMNQLCRALLTVQIDNRVFAITYGHAKHLFDYDRIVRSFGLRVVVNAVPVDSLFGLDMRQFERLSMQTLRRTPDEEPLKNFGVNWTKDILRAVIGRPIDEEFAVKAAGADPLVLRTRYSLKDLPVLCVKAIKYFNSTDYQRTQFKYIDWFQPETDSRIVDGLDKKLSTALLSEVEPRPHIAIDGIVDPGTVLLAQFKDHRFYLDSKRLRNYLLQQQGNGHDVIALLKKGRVLEQNAISEELDSDSSGGEARGSVYGALTWSHLFGRQQYLFVSGSWLRVDLQYTQMLEANIKFIKDPPSSPLPAAGAENDENKYIELVCGNNRNLLNLQSVLSKDEEMNYGLEVCDILGSEGSLYCIKTGNVSSKLSHLFSQGRGAGITLLTNQGFRRKLREKIADAARLTGKEADALRFQNLIPEHALNPDSYEICFCIIKKRTEKWPLCIPYLSQISLHEAYLRLVDAGYRVALQCIDLHEKPSPPSTPAMPPIRRRPSDPRPVKPSRRGKI